MNLKLSLAFLLPTVALSCPIYNKLLEDLPIGNPCLANGKNDEEKSQRTLQDQEVPELIPNTGPDYGGGALMILKNNALFHPQGIARPFYRDPQTGEGVAMADVIAHYSSGDYGESFPGVGKDLCYFTFQSLPPPAYIEDQSEVVPRTVDGVPQTFYNFPKSDMERFMYLADLAATRMTTQIEQGNPSILFGGGSSGSEAAKALCAMNISGTEGSQCDDARSNSEVAWSQAIVIFKVNPENLDSLKSFVIDEWRNSVHGHLPNMHWVFPFFGEGEDLIASNHNGWGYNGGLRAKLVQCDKIDPKFIKPKGVNGNTVMGSDAIDPSTGRTYGEEAFKEWERLCGIPILGNPNSDCVIDADIPESAVEEEPDNTEVKAKSALLPFDEKCIYSNEYIDKSRACGTKLTAAWGDSTKLDMFEKELNELTDSCGVQFCDDRGYSGEQFFIDSSGFLHCGADEAPTECNGGITYMTALRDYGTCVLSAMEKVSTTKKEASAQALSETDAVLSTDAERSLESCESMIECEAKVASSITDEWSIKFCMNFFSALKDPDLNPDFYDQFGWVADCGFGGDGTPESDVYKSCADLFINDADVEEEVEDVVEAPEETSSSSSFVYSMVVNTFAVLVSSAILVSIN